MLSHGIPALSGFRLVYCKLIINYIILYYIIVIDCVNYKLIIKCSAHLNNLHRH